LTAPGFGISVGYGGDDMPGTAQVPFVYNVHDEASWKSLAQRIIDKHID
jgi:hypothetical protein